MIDGGVFRMLAQETSKRTARAMGAGQGSSDAPRFVELVRRSLAALDDSKGLAVKASGAHVLVGRTVVEDEQPSFVARLTVLGPDAVGLTFRDPTGRWAPMLLIDALDEVLASLTVAI
jgi:hypothetical protein